MSIAEQTSLPETASSVNADCVAFVNDGQTHNVVAGVLGDMFTTPLVLDGGTKESLQYLMEVMTPPRIMIVDLGESNAPLAAMLSLTTAFTDETKLIGIGTVNDVSLYRELIGAGVSDYLVKPVTEKALTAAITRAQQSAQPIQEASQADAQETKRIAVIGSRGGVGASTVAVSLAWIFGEERKKKTVLLDLDLEFGTVALALDLEPTRGLREALETPARIDSLFISSAMAKVSEHLSVLATEETLRLETNFDPSAIDVLFEALSRGNECVVIDLPRPAFAVRERVLQQATDVILVTELTLAGLRDSIRILSSVDEAAPNVPVTVIANRSGGSHEAVKKAEFQKALGRKVDFLMPEDSKAFTKAANSGKPLVVSAKSSKAVKLIRQVADKLGTEEEPKTPAKGKGKGKAPAGPKKKMSFSLFKKKPK